MSGSGGTERGSFDGTSLPPSAGDPLSFAAMASGWPAPGKGVTTAATSFAAILAAEASS